MRAVEAAKDCKANRHELKLNAYFISSSVNAKDEIAEERERKVRCAEEG